MKRRIPGDLIRHLQWNSTSGVTPPTPTATPSGRVSPQAEYPEIVRNNPRSYIQVPQYDRGVIAVAESHKGSDLYETLEKVANEGLTVPRISFFRQHWENVRKAGLDKSEGLVYSDGTPVSEGDAVDLWKYFSSGHRGGCWTWLNARFRTEGGSWYMDKNLTVGTNPAGEKILMGESEPLDCPIRQDKWTELSFNEQGFPTMLAANQRNEPGKNMYFWHPRENAVAGFVADSGRAGLGCNWGAGVRNASLGVFACAAGIASQNSGGSL